MDEKFTKLTPDRYQYVLDHNAAEDEVLRALAVETLEVGPLAGAGRVGERQTRRRAE
jgi:hypothetical protein